MIATVSWRPGAAASRAVRSCRTNEVKAAFCPMGTGSRSTFTPSTPRRTTSAAISFANRARRAELPRSATVTAVSSGDHEKRETDRTTLVPAAWARASTAAKTDPFQASHRLSCWR